MLLAKRGCDNLKTAHYNDAVTPHPLCASSKLLGQTFIGQKELQREREREGRARSLQPYLIEKRALFLHNVEDF